MKLSYKSAIELLQSQSKFYINPGTQRVQEILNILDNPQNKLKVIHIAGTNGKGSVCSMLANILKCAGYKTGLYTSPHLVEYTERIKINFIDITKDYFTKYLNEVLNLAENNNIDLTEFELLTIMAYKYFYDNKVDFAIIETGLGGRFDATNVCNNPILEIITSISEDHTDRLGNTIEQIAFEKGGIIKNNSTVVISEKNLGFEVIKKIAKEKNATLKVCNSNVELLYENNKNYAIYEGKKYELSLLGTYQKDNFALAMCAIENLGVNINNIALIKGFKTVKWGARLEYIKEKNILIDGAHNPDGALELKKSLDYYFKNQKRIFIYSTINTKDYKKIAKILFDKEDEIYFMEFNHKNAVSYEEYIKNINFLNNIKKIEQKDIYKIINPNILTVITGSLYMIGEIYNRVSQ